MQQFVGYLCNAVASLGLQQVVGDSRVIVGRVERDAVLMQHYDQPLDIAAHDTRLPVKQGGNGLEHIALTLTWDIGRLVDLAAQGNAQNLELHGAAACTQQANGDTRLRLKFAHQSGDL